MNQPLDQSTPTATPEQQLLILRILWFSLMGATGVFAFLSFTLSQTNQNPYNEQMSQIIFIIAALVAVAGKFVPPFLAKSSPNKQSGLMVAHIIRYALFDAVGVLVFVNIIVFGVPFQTGAYGFLAVLILFLFNPPRTQI